MPTKSQFVRHVFDGGWASDFGLSSEVAVDEFGRLRIPFLIEANNVEYALDGGPRKIGGAAKVNSTAVESGEEVRGLVDYWKQGASGSPSQKRVIHAGTKILKEDLDGVFDDLFTGLEDDTVPSYEIFDDILIISSDSNTDVPKSWDQSTAQNLAGSPPNFAFSKTHKNRLWAAGVVTNPSTLYYSVGFDPEDWTGSGSGTIQINPNDGDRITALASYKDELWVFKGPYKGSIHRITGSAPTGADAFARRDFISGLGAVSHNLLFQYKDDIGFVWSNGSIHSLKAVAAFGDFEEAALSRPIATWIRDHVNFNLLKRGWAVNSSNKERVLFTLPVDGATNNNAILMMDYRFDPPRWAYWDSFACSAIAEVIDQSDSNRTDVWGGFTDGFVRKLDRSNRSIDSTTGIAGQVITPYMHYGEPATFKHLSALSISLQPKGNYNLTFKWKRDSNTQQSYDVHQGGGDVLGTAPSDQFTLGTSVLGGVAALNRYAELHEGGEFRTIQYEIFNDGIDEDFEVGAFATRIAIGAESLEND